jgi:hypothetical protein
MTRDSFRVWTIRWLIELVMTSGPSIGKWHADQGPQDAATGVINDNQ